MGCQFPVDSPRLAISVRQRSSAVPLLCVLGAPRLREGRPSVAEMPFAVVGWQFPVGGCKCTWHKGLSVRSKVRLWSRFSLTRNIADCMIETQLNGGT